MSEVKSVFVAGLLLALGGLGMFLLKSDDTNDEPKTNRKQKQKHQNDDDSIETYDSENLNDNLDDFDEYDDNYDDECEDDMCYPEEKEIKKSVKTKTVKNKKPAQKKGSKRRY